MRLFPGKMRETSFAAPEIFVDLSQEASVSIAVVVSEDVPEDTVRISIDYRGFAPAIGLALENQVGLKNTLVIREQGVPVQANRTRAFGTPPSDTPRFMMRRMAGSRVTITITMPPTCHYAV